MGITTRETLNKKHNILLLGDGELSTGGVYNGGRMNEVPRRGLYTGELCTVFCGIYICIRVLCSKLQSNWA